MSEATLQMNESWPAQTSFATEDVADLMARVRDRVAQRRRWSAPKSEASEDDTAHTSGTDDEVSNALAAQADFNRSTISVLGEIGQKLEQIGERISSVEGELQERSGGQAEEAARLRDLAE